MAVRRRPARSFSLSSGPAISSMLRYRRCSAGKRWAAPMPIAGWMPFASPSSILASASVNQVSYLAPPEGSQARRSSVPEVELSTSAFTFAGWAMA